MAKIYQFYSPVLRGKPDDKIYTRSPSIPSPGLVLFKTKFISPLMLARFWHTPIELNKNQMSSKYDYKRGSGGGFALGLFVGATLGALAALLFAPKSGNETRQQLKDLADQQKDKLKNQWEETKLKAAIAVDDAKEKLNTVADQAKEAVDVYADKAKGSVDQLADGTKASVDKFQKRY
jgi:gas vesicle protein